VGTSEQEKVQAEMNLKGKRRGAGAEGNQVCGGEGGFEFRAIASRSQALRRPRYGDIDAGPGFDKRSVAAVGGREVRPGLHKDLCAVTGTVLVGLAAREGEMVNAGRPIVTVVDSATRGCGLRSPETETIIWARGHAAGGLTGRNRSPGRVFLTRRKRRILRRSREVGRSEEGHSNDVVKVLMGKYEGAPYVRADGGSG